MTEHTPAGELRDKLAAALASQTPWEFWHAGDVQAIAEALVPTVTEALADAWDAGYVEAARYFTTEDEALSGPNPYRDVSAVGTPPAATSAETCTHTYPRDMPDEVLSWKCIDCGEWVSEVSAGASAVEGTLRKLAT